LFHVQFAALFSFQEINFNFFVLHGFPSGPKSLVAKKLVFDPDYKKSQRYRKMEGFKIILIIGKTISAETR